MRVDLDLAHTRLQAQRELQRLVDEHHAPGISYAVVTSDRVVFQGSAGVADAAEARAVSSDTRFMAFSITKALTAIAVVRLAERGALSLDDRLGRYLPDQPYGPEVTLRGLLGHTAGIPAPMPLDWFFVAGEPVDHHAALRATVRANPSLDSRPGTRYAYSNLGYWLVEEAIEAATGRPFAKVFHDELYAPLGIGRGAAFSLEDATSLATGHARRLSLSTPAFYIMTPSRYWSTAADGWSRFAPVVSHGLAYGGLYAWTGDLVPLLQDLLRDEGALLSRAARQRLFAPDTLSDGTPTGGTLGWAVGRLGDTEYRGKQGGGLGFHGNVRLYPEAGIATVYLANSTRVRPGPIDALSDRLDAPFLTHGDPPLDSLTPSRSAPGRAATARPACPAGTAPAPGRPRETSPGAAPGPRPSARAGSRTR